MGNRPGKTNSVGLSRKWLIVLFIGLLLLAYKLMKDQIMGHVNVVNHALKIEALDISAPQFSIDLQAFVVTTRGIWDVPSYLLPHSDRTVVIEHIFRGYDYEGRVTYHEVLGRDRTFSLTRLDKEAILAFDKMIYRAIPNILEIEPGKAFFKNGVLERIESPRIKLTTDEKIFVGEKMVMTIGIDPHEIVIHFDAIIFEKQIIDDFTLTLNTNLLIKGIKTLELNHVEGKGKMKDVAFDFMWNKSKDEDNQLKLSGFGTIPLAAFKAIITPMKLRLLQNDRVKMAETHDKMKILQFDLLKKLSLKDYEKKLITRFIPEGYYRKDKTFFHFDIRPDAVLRELPPRKTAETYFKMAKDHPNKSIRYLRNSCGLGYGEACFRLGSLTEKTSNSTQNAIPFFELGCTFKHKESCKKSKLLSTNN